MSDREGLPAAFRQTEILERITDAFFALDRRWRFTYLNDRAEEMLERSREHLLGQVIWDEFPETVETEFPEGFHRAMETQEPVAFEVYHKPLDTWFEARAYPSGTGLTVSLRDVTDRKERQRELAQYETIVETLRDGVLKLDADNRITLVNEGFERMFDVDRSEILGEGVGAIAEVATIDTEGIQGLGHGLDMLRRGDVDHHRIELCYQGPDGDDRVAETQMVALGEGELAGVVRDVTEQREYERVVRSLHAITPELLSADDPLEICSIAVHAAGEVLDLRVSGIWLLDEGFNRMEPVAGTAGAHEELGGLPHFPRGEGVVWETFRSGEPARFDDVRDHETADQGPLRSEIVVPVGEHGVLMAGETTPGALTETDLELATILGANIEAALDRADRDQLLRRSQDTLERQNERLEVVEAVLSTDLQDQLAVAAGRAREADAEEAVEPLMRARRLAGDALELATGELSVGPRGPVEVGEVATTAAELVEGVELDVAEGAWLRADRDRLVRLFETVFVDARDRARGAGEEAPDPGAAWTAVPEEGPTDDGAGPPGEDPADSGEDPPREEPEAPGEDPTGGDPDDPGGDPPGEDRPGDEDCPAGFEVPAGAPTDPGDDPVVNVELGLVGRDGIYLADDAPPMDEADREHAFDLGRATDGTGADDGDAPGLGLAVAGEIAAAHGWGIRATADEDGGMCFEITDVTTLGAAE